MAEHTGDPSILAEVGDPIPGENALHRDDQITVEPAEGTIQMLWLGRHVPVKQGFSLSVQDADIHLPCLGCVPQAKPRNAARIDADVEFVLFFIEPH